MLSASLLLTFFAGTAFAAGSVTTAGNASVSQDTCLVGNATTGNITITTTAGADIAPGTIVFDAPAGFVFDTSAAAPSVVANTTLAIISFGTRTATSVTYNVSTSSIIPGVLTVNLGRIRTAAPNCSGPKAGTTGNVTIGSVNIAGIAAGTSAGTYTVTAGVDNSLVATASPASRTVGQSVTVSAQITDFWGNNKATNGTSVTFTANPSSPGCTGTFTGGNPVATAGGVASTTFGPVGGGGCTYTFTASNPGLTSGTSNTVTVAASAISATCGGGANIEIGENFTCNFTVTPADPTVTFVNWTQSGAGSVTPASSTNTSQQFTGATVGAVTITATYTDNSGTHTININKNVRAATVSCNPADGSTIALNSTVTCTFGPGTHSAVVWSNDGNFAIGANNANSATFTAVNTGTGHITVNYNTPAGAQSQTFTYQIVNSLSGGSCAWSTTLAEPRGGAAAGPTSLTCTEGAINDFGNGFSFRIHKAPAAPGAGALHFDTTKAISVIAPSSLGLTASYVNDTTILIQSNPPSGHTDQNNIEQFTIGNIFDKADAGTTLGTIVTTVTNSNGAIGNNYFIGGATANATGTMTAPITAVQNNFNVTVSSTCPFAVTGGGNSVLTFSGTGDTVAITAVSGVVGGVQNITVAAHANPESGAVTQTVANCNTFPSIGSVVDALILTSDGTPIVNQGQTNQGAANIHIAEQAFGFIPTGTVCTGTISEPGVVFSNSPTVSGAGNGLTLGTATLSGDRKSFSFTVTHASTSGAGQTITVSNIKYDVDAATSVQGDFVKVTVTCGALLVSPTGVNNAVVGNSINISATVKTVFIAQNDQESGIITIDEVIPGTFGASGSLNKNGVAAFNQLTFCTNNGATYTRAPWLVVTKGGPATTPSADGLQLLNTTTHQGTNQQQGVLSNGNTCATFTFYSGSTTTAGEIQLVGGVAAPDTAHGAGYNIAPGALVGPVQVSINGLSVAGTTVLGVVVNALKQFKSDVTVTATSAPFIAPGTIDGAAGDIVIAATDTNAQFVAGETIRCNVLNSAFNQNQQVFLEMTNQNESPVISTTGTGMVAHLQLGPSNSNQFQVIIDQAPTNATLGTITISNLHYTVVTGTTLGPVIVECFHQGGGGSLFDQFVTNANIGTAPPPPPAPTPSAIRVLGAYGKTTTGPYNNNQTFLIRLPLVKTANDRLVTLDFQASAAGHPATDFNGMRVQICIATKANPEGGSFGGFNTCTTRALGGFITGGGTPSSNEAWYFASSKTPAWISIRVRLVGNSSIATSPWAQTVQIHWTGHTGKSLHA